MKQGKFITLEGIDGAGKSTQLAWIVELLQRAGLSAVVTREPGGTPLGEQLRALLLDKSISMHPETEALLMFAARREHLDKVILPALAQGQWVISDRFTDASFAYQSGGRGLDSGKLAILEQWVQGTLQPDLTLYFDVVAVLGGYLIADAQLTIPFYAFVESITKALSTTDVLMTAIKGLSFGSAVAAICCYHGLAVRSSFTEVPQQTTRAMINSFVLCLLIDVVVTVPLYL